jgi:hypothetical protein
MRFPVFLLLSSLFATSSSAADAPAPPTPAVGTPIRVYFAPLSGPEGEASLPLMEERLLVASRRHAGFAVLGATDMRRLLDADALRQAMDCDAESCMAELADGIGAPQIITGQLGHIGETWVLTLSRINRETMAPITRVARESRGSTPEGLLSQTDRMMAEVLGAAVPEPSVSPLVVVGGATIGVAALLAVGGVIALGFNYDYYNRNQIDGKVVDGVTLDEFRAGGQSRGLVVAGLFGGAGAVGAVGVGLLAVGLLGAE